MSQYVDPLTYRGEQDGRQYLVTIYPDGSGELAIRDHPGDVWSPPIELEDWSS